METVKDVIIRYLQDCEAAERNFEDALAKFSKAGNQKQVQEYFAHASQVARSQHERLESRIRALGGEPSTGKSMLAHMLGMAPTVAQLGHHDSEKNSQDLMICYSAAAAEMAMYEALATVAAQAGDGETERLARELQAQEKKDHEDSWNLLHTSVQDSWRQMTSA